MVKESLSSDVDFIKEFEELKIKQKLLVESLKKKGQGEQERLFLEINSKLDFLVKIFKEANSSSEDEKEHVDFEDKFNKVFDKLDDMSNTFLQRLSKVESSIEKVSENKPILSSPTSSGNGDGTNLPPAPNFSSNVEDKVEKVSEEGEKKKKKWF